MSDLKLGTLLFTLHVVDPSERKGRGSESRSDPKLMGVSKRRERKLEMEISDLENQEGEQVPLTEPTGTNGYAKGDKKSATSSTSLSLALNIAAWYASSVLCTNTTKTLQLPWTTLTFFQMLISTICGICGILIFKLDGKGTLKLWPTRDALALTVLLSLVFSAGFVTLNSGLAMMHVSVVMSLRAAEPVATWVLGLILLPDEKTSRRSVLALLVIVLGAALSAVSREANVNIWGLSLVLGCNVCFALRTLITKRLKKQCDIDNFNLFLQLCLMGSIWQSIIAAFAGFDRLTQGINVPILLLNGLTFYLYLQLSWVVMSQIGAVTHSAVNSLRRPVICAAGWIAFGGATVEGVAGVLIATAGTMLYARSR